MNPWVFHAGADWFPSAGVILGWGMGFAYSTLGIGASDFVDMNTQTIPEITSSLTSHVSLTNSSLETRCNVFAPHEFTKLHYYGLMQGQCGSFVEKTRHSALSGKGISPRRNEALDNNAIWSKARQCHFTNMHAHMSGVTEDV
jgi:hypothetical protein